MKGRTIVLDHVNGLEAAAYLVDGKLDDLLIDDSDAPRPGAIFRAICDRPIKGQGGMMLRLPGGETAFLRQGKGLSPGQAMLVQVTGYSEDGKAVPVTDRVLFKSRFAIVTPGKPGLNISRQIEDEDTRDELLAVATEVHDDTFGLILRSSCEGADPEEIMDDILSDAFDSEGVEEEAEHITNQVLAELGIELDSQMVGLNAPHKLPPLKQGQQQISEEDQAVADLLPDLKARLDKL